MKKELIIYYLGVVIFFVALLFSVRHLVNTTRVFVGYEDSFSPTLIKWRLDEKDSTLRIKDPLYLKKDYYLIDYKNDKFIKNQITNIAGTIKLLSTTNQLFCCALIAAV